MLDQGLSADIDHPREGLARDQKNSARHDWRLRRPGPVASATLLFSTRSIRSVGGSRKVLYVRRITATAYTGQRTP